MHYASLRAGDIVSMGRVQFCVLLEDDPSTPLLPPRRRTPMEGAARIAASRAVLRGVAGWSHGHTFALDNGLRKDTLLVSPSSTTAVHLDATNPGTWALHCQNEYHTKAGMMLTMRYKGR